MLKPGNALFTIFLAVLMLAGCGSGSAVTLPQQQKSATVIFSATNAALSTPVSGFEITAKMPAGATVHLLGTSNQLDNAYLSAKLTNSSILGSYSPTTREITLLITPSSLPTTWALSGSVGAFAEIRVDCQPDLTKASFTGINPSFPGFKVSDGTSPGPTSQFTPSMDVLGL